MLHQISVPRPGIEALPLVVKAWNPNHWTAREFRIINNFLNAAVLTRTYCIAHWTLLNAMRQPGREGSWGRMDTCICVAELLCCPPETITWLIGYGCMLSHFSPVWLFATLWTVTHQAPLSMGFSRQEYWSGLPCPSPGDLPDPGRKQPSSHLDLSPLSLILSKMEGYLQTNSLTEAEHITQGPETLWLEGAGAGAPSMWVPRAPRSRVRNWWFHKRGLKFTRKCKNQTPCPCFLKSHWLSREMVG